MDLSGGLEAPPDLETAHILTLSLSYGSVISVMVTVGGKLIVSLCIAARDFKIAFSYETSHF